MYLGRGLLRSASAAMGVQEPQGWIKSRASRDLGFSLGNEFVSNFLLFGGPMESGPTAIDEGLSEQHLWI